MKTLIISVFILIVQTSFSQTNSHIFFGINLDLDWYSLTNSSPKAYYLKSEKIKDGYAVTSFEFSHDKIDRGFMDLGFNELLLFFPKGMQNHLKELKPEIFLARMNYNNTIEYSENIRVDFSKILHFLKKEFGEPEVINSSVYKWNGIDYELSLSTDEDYLNTTLLYLKKLADKGNTNSILVK